MQNDLYALLGVKKKELLTLSLNAWKMIWEQLLLLAINARQQYFKSDSSDNFHQRIKMVHILKEELMSRRGYQGRSGFSEEDSQIFREIYKMLESESGSNQIIKYLLDDKEENKPLSVKRVILRKMEKNKIAFPPAINCVRYYSYYSHYQILKDPIVFFQKLLHIPFPTGEFIDNITVTTVRRVIENDTGYKIRKSFMPFNVESDIDFIKENNEILNKDKDIYKLIKGQIADSIGRYIQKPFKQLSDPFFDEMDSQETKLFSNIIKILPRKSDGKDDIELVIDRERLVMLINLNQTDELSEKIKFELNNIADGADRASVRRFGFNIDEKIEQSDALEKISHWYELSRTDIFNRREQIPKIIASILEFDIRYFKGFFDSDLGFSIEQITKKQQYQKALPANEIYTLVSAFIRNYLYYNDSRLYKYGYGRDEINNYLIDDMINRDFSDITTFKNTMMDAWITFETIEEIKNMSDRFKRLSLYLNTKKFKDIEPQIKKQQEVRKIENAPAYPLNSFFPLPLWANRIYTNKDIED
jgi:hypothetical protein